MGLNSGCFRVSCENLASTVSVVRDFLVYHEEREVHEGFGFFLIFCFPLFVLKLFFFVIFVSFVVMLLHRKPRRAEL